MSGENKFKSILIFSHLFSATKHSASYNITKNDKSSKKIPLSKPLNTPSKLLPQLPQTINSRKQVLIMMSNPIKKDEIKFEDNRVEEIIDEDENASIIVEEK